MKFHSHSVRLCTFDVTFRIFFSFFFGFSKRRTLHILYCFIIFLGHLDIVKYLAAHNAEINLANAYNNTCLMISAYKGHTDVVEFLLSNGADPDQQAHCGATALHYAAECGHVDICSALLEYGATLQRNEYDMTAVTTAAERTRESVVELFYCRPDLLTKVEVGY